MASRRLEDLTPDTRAAAEALLAFANDQGIEVMVTHTLRTCEEQNELYAQGRTKPGAIVTNAPGCRSWHVQGRALDVLVIDESGKVVHNGLDPSYAILGEHSRTLGFKWGGDFKDYGHFEYHPGMTIGQACPDPNVCSSVALPPAFPPTGSGQMPEAAGAIVAVFCLGAVGFMFADIHWSLSDRLIKRLAAM